MLKYFKTIDFNVLLGIKVLEKKKKELLIVIFLVTFFNFYEIIYLIF